MMWLNRLAETWWSFFALHMAEIALFLLLLATVERVFKLNITTRYALWLLGLAKIFVPPIITLPEKITESAPANLLTNFIVVPATLTQEAEKLSPYTLLLGLWALSVVLFFGLMIKRYVQMRRSLRRAKPITPFAALACPTFETERIVSPVLFGVLQPQFYVPQDWRSWSPQQLQSILQHEAAHLHGRDLWTLGLEALALMLFGLNPLVWLLRRRLHYLRELRCDLAAISHTGIAPLDYGKLLYAFAEKQSQPSAALAAGITFAAQHSTLYQRLQHLLTRKESDMKINRFGRIVLLGMMGVALLAFSWQCSGSKLMDKAPLAPETATQTAASQQAEFDTPPEIATFVGPQYPEAAKQAQVQGMVFVHMELDTEGNVAAARVLRSREMTEVGTEDVDALGYGLEEAALAAARATKFKPATKEGKPQRVTITMPFNFKLDDTATQPLNKEAAPAAPTFQNFDQAPEMLSAFELKYPELVRKAGITGTTYLEIGISATGETETVRVAKSSGNETLDQAAVAAAQDMKWKPAYYQGKPVAVKATLPAQFKLSE